MAEGNLVMAFSKPNYTQIPNEFLDRIASKLKESGLRVMLAAFRQTFGYQDYRLYGKPKPMAKSFFAEITGLSKRSVDNGVKEACEMGLLVLVDYNGDNGCARYVVPLDGDVWENLGCEENPDDGGAEFAPLQNLHPTPAKFAPQSQVQGGAEFAPIKEREKKSKENIRSSDLIGSTDPILSDDEFDPYSQLEGQDLWSKPEDLQGEPVKMMGIIQEKVSGVNFTQSQRKRMTQAVTIKNHDGTSTTYPSLEELAGDDDFRRFAKQRIEMLQALWKSKPESSPKGSSVLKTIVTHLQKYTNKSKSPEWNGWLLWQKENSVIRNAAFKSTKVSRGAETTSTILDYGALLGDDAEWNPVAKEDNE